MPSPLKIGLCKRYHSETPCKVCPKQLAAHPETPEQIPRYQIGAAAQSPVQSIQRRQIPTGTRTDRQTVPTESTRTDHAKPEQLVTVSPRRIFHRYPVRGLRSRFTAPLFCYCKVCRSALSVRFSDELHQICVCGNS